VTVNLALRSLKVPGFLRSLARLIASAPDVGNRIVLELPQESWRAMDDAQRDAVLALRDHGISLSLDRAPDLQFDAQSLADHGVRFLKLPADLMLAAAAVAQSDDEMCVRDFAPLLLRAGIKLVAERVEREEMVPALAELGVPLAQGFVFAAPRAVRGEVLDPKVAGRELPDRRDRSGKRLAG
jgi:cyclic-di-GMP phosphodiesterase TipF (flagellum assembly factor)